MRSAMVEIHKEELKFSAGHFMLLSADQRESMHGHDYQIHVTFDTLIKNNGMAFDCRFYEQKIKKICQSLDYHFILPNQSEYLRIEDAEDKWIVYFGQQAIPFLKQDTIILPICNVTLEELSYWFLQQLTEDEATLRLHHIQKITLKVSNGRGEFGATCWPAY